MINPENPKYAQAFSRVLRIMNELREQCPWDKKQTIQSLSYLTIEETHELADAILKEDWKEIEKEIGDIFLHLIFYARIADEENRFDFADVINTLCEKLIFRHPHVYGDVVAEDEEAVKRNWEQLKRQEKGNEGVLAGVPVSLPSLVKAMRIQEKARAVGFDWERPEQVWQKVEEEMHELHAELNQSTRNPQKIEAEFGDLLFALVNFARFIDVNAEIALERTNLKFTRRFNFLESESKKDGKILSEMTLPDMDIYWERAKTFEKH